MATSNLPFGRWGATFSDDVVAAAIIDRLLHRAEVLTAKLRASAVDHGRGSRECDQPSALSGVLSRPT
jgi:DNA replication protein DnaC